MEHPVASTISAQYSPGARPVSVSASEVKPFGPVQTIEIGATEPTAVTAIVPVELPSQSASVTSNESVNEGVFVSATVPHAVNKQPFASVTSTE